jgi:Tfp pilus assembly protein PilF
MRRSFGTTRAFGLWPVAFALRYCLPGLLAVAFAAAPAAAQGGDFRQTLAGARRMLERGDYRNAEGVYADVLRLLPESDSILRAAAHFGRAFAAQQLLVTGDTVDRRVDADSIVRDYRQAAALNREALGAAATNNIAVVLGELGRHLDAAHLFLALAGVNGAERSSHYAQAGREFDRGDNADSATWAFRRSLEFDRNNGEALRALLDLLVRSRPASEVLKLTTQYTDSASARDVSTALVSLLVRPGDPLGKDDATEAMVQLARTWPRMRMGTPYFDVALREPLTQAVERQPSVKGGLLAMIEAYTLRPSNAPFRESANAHWWHSDDGRPDGKSAAWSTLLRSIGDWLNQQGSLTVARSYYEAAVGLHEGSLNSPSIDRSALLPLALIYAQQADTASSSRLHDDLRQFTEIIFSAKGQAYRTGDLEQIRIFHMTLGAFYAARGQWTGPGAQNAEFQLEHMREATRALGQASSAKVIDPPDLLEKLAIHYKSRGRADLADNVKRDLVRQLQDEGRSEEAAAAARRIDAVRRAPQIRHRDARVMG